MKKKTIKKTGAKTSKLTKEEREEQFWGEVDQLAQDKIYQLLTSNLPLPNLNQITEPWRYEDRQQKLTGLFLHRDVDYRTLLSDIEEQYGLPNYQTEARPDQESLAEEIAVWYYQMVMKSLIEDLSDYGCYESHFFENLTN